MPIVLCRRLGADPGFLERGFVCMKVCVWWGRFADFISFSHIHGTAGTHRRSNPGTEAPLRPRFHGPKGGGHTCTNDWCIKT